MCVHNDIVRGHETQVLEVTPVPSQRERNTLRHFHVQTDILQNWKMRQRNKTEIAKLPCSSVHKLSSSYSASKPTAPPSNQLQPVMFQTSRTQTFSLLRRNKAAATLLMYSCLGLFWNPVFTQGYYHYFQLQLLHMQSCNFNLFQEALTDWQNQA